MRWLMLSLLLLGGMAFTYARRDGNGLMRAAAAAATHPPPRPAEVGDAAAAPATTRASQAAPGARTQRAVATLKADLDAFRLTIAFWPDPEQKIRAMGLTLSVKPYYAQAPLVTREQALKIIEHLAAHGFFERAGDVSMRDRMAAPGPAYTMTVFGAGELEENLGWSLHTWTSLKGLRSVMEQRSADEMDKLLKMLEPFRAAWQEQARMNRQVRAELLTRLDSFAFDIEYRVGPGHDAGLPSATLRTFTIRDQRMVNWPAQEITQAHAAAIIEQFAQTDMLWRGAFNLVKAMVPPAWPHYRLSLRTSKGEACFVHMPLHETLAQRLLLARPALPEAPGRLLDSIVEAVRLAVGVRMSGAEAVAIATVDARAMDGHWTQELDCRLRKPGRYVFFFEERRRSGEVRNRVRLTAEHPAPAGAPAAVPEKLPAAGHPRLTRDVARAGDMVRLTWTREFSPRGPKWGQGWAFTHAAVDGAGGVAEEDRGGEGPGGAPP